MIINKRPDCTIAISSVKYNLTLCESDVDKMRHTCSTISSSLNALAAITWDVLKNKISVGETAATTLIKLMGN